MDVNECLSSVSSDTIPFSESPTLFTEDLIAASVLQLKSNK